MPNNNLILRTVNSPWTTPTADFTKNSVLSHTNVDNNFIYLRGELIYTAQTIGNTVTLKKINGNDLSFNVGSGGTSGGSVYWTSGSSGNYSIKVINDGSGDTESNYTLVSGFNNIITADSEYSSIMGGARNTIGGSINGHILGGYDNSVNKNSDLSVVIAGSGNTIGNGSTYSSIINGFGNEIGISNHSHSSILGGQNNQIGSVESINTSIIGGSGNTVQGGDNSTLIGGAGNILKLNSDNSTIMGGTGNTIDNSDFSAIIGGQLNKISGLNGVIVIGGTGITAATEDTVYVPKLNVGTGAPDSKLHVGGAYGDLKVRLDNDNSNSTNQLLLTSDEGDYTNFMSIGTTTPDAQLDFGLVGPSSTLRVVGNPDDSFIAATSAADNMNFINNAGVGTTDNIGFYAGKTLGTDLSATTSDIIILGDGADRGYVGIGTDTPTEKLDVVSNLKVRGQAYTPIYDNLSGGTTFIPDWDNSNVQILTLSGNTNVSGGASTMKGGSAYTMLVKQSNGGSHTITYDSTYKWEEGNPPTLSTADGSVDIITFICDGTSLYGLIAKDFQ